MSGTGVAERFLWPCCLLLGWGCASLSSVQTASTLGRGHFQLGVEPGVRLQSALADPTRSGSATWVAPHVDVAARYGVTDRLDVGVRGGTSLVELQGKYLLTSPENSRHALAFAPTLGGWSSSAGGLTVHTARLQLPLLWGLKVDGGSEFVLGPRLDSRAALGTTPPFDGAVWALRAGGSVGFAWRATRLLRLLPELGFLAPIALTVARQNVGRTGLAAATMEVQLKLGLLFGPRTEEST